jgi:hypothetical protein
MARGHPKRVEREESAKSFEENLCYGDFIQSYSASSKLIFELEREKLISSFFKVFGV